MAGGVERRSYLCEESAPLEVPVAVVDPLEVVNIDHDERKIPPGPDLSAYFLFKLFHKHAVVVQTRQFVYPRKLQGLLEQLRLFESRGNKVGNRPEKIKIFHPESIGRTVAETHDAEDPRVIFQRHPDIAAGCFAFLGIVEKGVEQTR